MSEQALKVALESAVLAFIPVWAEVTGGAAAVADWRQYFPRLCYLFVRGADSEAFPDDLDAARSTVEAKLAYRFNFDAAEALTGMVVALAERATAVARKLRTNRQWRTPKWDGAGEGTPAEVARFEPLLVEGWPANGRILLVIGGVGAPRNETTVGPHLPIRLSSAQK